MLLGMLPSATQTAIASVNAPLQASIAVSFGGNYALALALVAGPGAVVIVILTALGIEAKGAVFGIARIPQPAEPKTARSPVLAST
jgi:SHS family lactate transporter-like MFS transporter